MFEQDYIMRTIHELVRTLLKLLFQIDEENSEDTLEEKEKKRYLPLRDKIDSGNINEAENQLLENLKSGCVGDLKLALLFYEHLNQKEDEFLHRGNYSREEIEEGIETVMRMYGYENLIDTLAPEWKGRE